MEKQFCITILLLLLTLIQNTSFANESLPKTCAFNGCKMGDIVTAYYSQGSPAVGCPTKSLSLYANYVISMVALGSTENELERSNATFMRQIRKDAGVPNLKATMNKCWRLEDGQQVKILEYSKGGSVKVSPTAGGLDYWTQANHLDR